jgi:iron(III) transport system substrate-binding protein
VVGVVTIVLVTLAGCGNNNKATAGDSSKTSVDDSPSVVKAAKAEGSVVWYTAIPGGAPDFVSAFEKIYGIKVDVVRYPGSTLEQRFSAEQKAGSTSADVISVADPDFYATGASSNWWSTLTPGAMPALSSWPSAIVQKHLYTEINTQPIGVTYNTDHLQKSDVDTWTKLADSKLAGHFVMPDPSNTPFYLAWLALLEDSDGTSLLNGIDALKPTIVDSVVPGAQLVGSGEDWLMAPSVVAAALDIKAQGAPVDTVIPSPTIGIEQYAAISKTAKHPNAAELLTNYMLTRAGQEQLDKGYAASPLQNIPGSIPMPADYRSPDLDAATARKAELLKALGL